MNKVCIFFLRYTKKTENLKMRTLVLKEVVVQAYWLLLLLYI